MQKPFLFAILVMLLTPDCSTAGSPSLQIAAWGEIAPSFFTEGNYDAGKGEIGTVKGYGGEIIFWDIFAIGMEYRDCNFYQGRMNTTIFPWPESMKDVSWDSKQTGYFGKIYFGPFKTVKQYIKFGAIRGKIGFASKYFYNPDAYENPPENFYTFEFDANEHWGTSFAIGCKTQLLKHVSFLCELAWLKYFLKDEAVYSTIRGDHILHETKNGFHYSDFLILKPRIYEKNLKWMEIRFGLRLSIGT